MRAMYVRSTFITLFLVIIGNVKCELDAKETSNLPNKDSGHKVSRIKPEHIDELKVSLNETDVSDIMGAKHFLEQMCGSDESKLQNSQNALKDIIHCFNETMKFSELPGKIENAKPDGKLDEVFTDYCLKTQEIQGCVHTFLIGVDDCLEDSKKLQKYTVQNITESILKFACDDNGERIALFISERGPQCIKEKAPQINKCIEQGIENTSHSENRSVLNTTTDNGISETIVNISTELQSCRNTVQVRKCIVEELKRCNNSTPANVMEAVFNLAMKSSPCNKYTRSELDPHNNAPTIFKSIIAIIIPIATVMFSRMLAKS